MVFDRLILNYRFKTNTIKIIASPHPHHISTSHLQGIQCKCLLLLFWEGCAGVLPAICLLIARGGRFIIIVQDKGMEDPLRISIATIQEEYESVTVTALGKGNSGSVYVYRRRCDGGEFALKIVKTDRRQKRAQALGEVQILRLLEHQRIVKIFKFYDESFTACGGEKRFEIGLLLQRGLGSLQQYVKDRNYHYDFGDILRFIVKFIELGAYLEAHEIVHRDIKPGNIIIFDDRLEFKLGDFGLSCRALERPRGFAGTPAYCSPGLKRFYKEGDHRLHPCTNAFKDDVYSFALTSQEVIRHRFSLEECPKEITSLLDQMLKHDQRERPTFTHLLHHETVQKCLRQWNDTPSQLNNSQSRKVELAPRQHGQAYTRKKMAGGEYTDLDNHTEKSRKVKHQQNIDCPKGLRTLCSIGRRYLLVGTSEGQLFVVDCETQESIRLSLTHGGYVAKVAVDSNGDIWTAGGDGKVYLIRREDFLRSIECNRQTVPVPKKKTFFSSNATHTEELITIPQECLQLMLDTPQEPFICQLLCLDETHFAVGYCSGTIRVRWGQQPMRIYRIHCHPITCLRVAQGSLYSADFEGSVKAYNLTKRIIQRSVYKFSQELLEISVMPAEGGRNIEGVSSGGQLQTINLFRSSKTTFHAELSAKQLVAAALTRRQYYLLTADGWLFLKNTPGVKLEGGQWACLAEVGEDEILVGSQQGRIAILTLE